MITSIIVAVSQNNVIGKDNQLPWHLPADLQYFKRLTMGHHIIMGRKTYESIGKNLPGRTFIVITKNKEFKAEGCFVVHSLDEALLLAKTRNESEAFIIGGAEIFNLSMGKADKIYLTKICQDFEGDTFFPEFNPALWREIKRENFEPDEKNKYFYSFNEIEKVH